MSKTRGKAFERECKQAYERHGATVYRNHDAMFGKGGMSAASLPDLWIMWPSGFVQLVEAKAFKSKSIAFNRIDGHQRQALEHHHHEAPNYEGGILLNHYNGELGQSRVFRCFYMTIRDWLIAEDELDHRKSLPLGELERRAVEFPWVPGTGWHLPLNQINPINKEEKCRV